MRSHRFTKPYNLKNYKFGIVALVGILSIFGILVVGSAKESLSEQTDSWCRDRSCGYDHRVTD